ncbi:hypothetical protein BB559_007563 [Furculomyces boomerangus]|uniref:Extracellular membrane protein CFEM domain-containing protein n=1 Tax=Furculomyces boomerangus TaxID=61424 RepID=A0A2T9XWV7_9FUNG|nr:hypothetical protein BB559_007563 [Furculomyces boomerangus]
MKANHLSLCFIGVLASNVYARCEADGVFNECIERQSYMMQARCNPTDYSCLCYWNDQINGPKPTQAYSKQQSSNSQNSQTYSNGGNRVTSSDDYKQKSSVSSGPYATSTASDYRVNTKNQLEKDGDSVKEAHASKSAYENGNKKVGGVAEGKNSSGATGNKVMFNILSAASVVGVVLSLI